MPRTKSIFTFILFCFVLTPIWSSGNSFIRKTVKAGCPSSQHRNLSNLLIVNLSGETKVPGWQRPFEQVVYRGCFIGLKRRSIMNLAKAAILSYKQTKNLEAIAMAVEAIGDKRFRFNEFGHVVNFIDKSSKAGLSEAELGSIYIEAPKSGFSKARLENFSAAYLALRRDKVEPEEALNVVKENKKVLVRAKTDSELKTAIRSFASADDKLWDELEAGLQEHNRIVINLDDPSPESPKEWDHKKLKRSVNSWLKTPYLWGGCSRRGVDCSCFVKSVILAQFKKFSIPRVSREQAKLGRFVNLKKLKPGDLVFFGADPGKKRITHVGIALGNDRFAHASNRRGVVIDKLSWKYYRTRLLKARRIVP